MKNVKLRGEMASRAGLAKNGNCDGVCTGDRDRYTTVAISVTSKKQRKEANQQPSALVFQQQAGWIKTTRKTPQDWKKIT